jgi:hypothetical protein
MIRDLGSPTYPMELWIDGDDLLRRERHFMTFDEAEGKFDATSNRRRTTRYRTSRGRSRTSSRAARRPSRRR